MNTKRLGFILILLSSNICLASGKISYEEVRRIEKDELWAASAPVVVSSDEGITVGLWRIDKEFPQRKVNGKHLNSIVGIGFGDIGESPVMLKLFSGDGCLIEIGEHPLSIIESCDVASGVGKSFMEIGTDHKGNIKLGDVVFRVSGG